MQQSSYCKISTLYFQSLPQSLDAITKSYLENVLKHITKACLQPESPLSFKVNFFNRLWCKAEIEAAIGLCLVPTEPAGRLMLREAANMPNKDSRTGLTSIVGIHQFIVDVLCTKAVRVHGVLPEHSDHPVHPQHARINKQPAHEAGWLLLPSEGSLLLQHCRRWDPASPCPAAAGPSGTTESTKAQGIILLPGKFIHTSY